MKVGTFGFFEMLETFGFLEMLETFGFLGMLETFGFSGMLETFRLLTIVETCGFLEMLETFGSQATLEMAPLHRQKRARRKKMKTPFFQRTWEKKLLADEQRGPLLRMREKKGRL